VSVLLCVVGMVFGVTQLDDVVYIVCDESSTIIRFSAATRQRLRDINVKDLRQPDDIAACQQTSQLYVTDGVLYGECIWRASSDGEDIKRWWTKSPSDTFKPWTVLRHFSRPLGSTPHIAVDSQGNIFVVDRDNRRILLLDARLSLRRVIIDEHQLNYKRPWRLCYNEQSAQLMVGCDYSDSVAVFDVRQR